jgi:hypothetical protein
MLVGAMVGGAVSVAGQWKARKNGEITSEQYLANVTKNTAKAGVMSGVTYMVGKTAASQSLFNLAAVFAAGAAGVYMLEKSKGTKADEQ